MYHFNLFLKKIFKINGETILLLLIFLLLFSSCNLKKPYVGMEFDTTNWPKYSSGEKISFQLEAADFEFIITKTNEEDEYLLSGTMDGSNGSLRSIGSLVTNECRFGLILAKDDVVVDNISFSPLGTDILHKLPFKKKFKAAPFDSITITYEISVSG